MKNASVLYEARDQVSRIRADDEALIAQSLSVKNSLRHYWRRLCNSVL